MRFFLSLAGMLKRNFLLDTIVASPKFLYPLFLGEGGLGLVLATGVANYIIRNATST